MILSTRNNYILALSKFQIQK